MNPKNELTDDLVFKQAVTSIKEAIFRSRYQAAARVNGELLSLYYAVGKFVSENSRANFWGKGAVNQLSAALQQELPGLRGFSASSIKRMREFYEEWRTVLPNRPLPTGDLPALATAKEKSEIPSVASSDNRLPSIDLAVLERHLRAQPESFAIAFLRTGFTHHSEILAKEKSLEGRLFYIARSAAEFWSVEALKSNLRGNLFARTGTMPNNFITTLSEAEQAHRAVRSFKDEYLLDFINIEDENDPDERVVEHGIVANIKRFLLSFGNKFCFIGNQYRLEVGEKEFFIDLLFFNRELHCLVAVELKRGEFKPSHLGQLHFYLAALDEQVRQADEMPSIGILLCKEANRSVVEVAVRDYTKPMGVATYRTRNEMPETWQKALPDFEAMRRVLHDTQNDKEAEE